MSYLLIENSGELEPEALYLMGASTKKDGKSIGMFGTGAKYAVAALLREDVQFTVYSGETMYGFSAIPVGLRGEEFHQVYLDKDKVRQPLSFTTEMGEIHWGVEQALRELVSNALDEPEPRIELVEDVHACTGKTRIFVAIGPKSQKFVDRMPVLFNLDREPLYEGENWKLYPARDMARVYRKGVLGLERQVPAAFDYDFGDVSINENRQIDPWTAGSRIARMLNEAPGEVKRVVLRKGAVKDSLESRMPHYHLEGKGWAEDLKDHVLVTQWHLDLFQRELQPYNTIVVDPDVMQKLGELGCRTVTDILSAAQLKGFHVIDEKELSRDERGRLRAGLRFLKRLGHDLERVQVVDPGEGKNVRGEYVPKEDTIYISREVLGESVHAVVKTLFHERAHQGSKAGDYDRDFADWLVAEWVRLAQNKTGRYL